MDFARKQLEKYGWREGQGLGKESTGITTAIKPMLKFDTAGIGHDAGKEFTNDWWNTVYNKAAKNIKVQSNEDEVKMELVTGESIEITTKNYSVKDFKKKNNPLEYGSFLKTSQLTEGGEVKYNGVSAPEEKPAFGINTLTDEELFAACGGRTAHKGARHGLKFIGKLSRIEKQEKLLLKKLQNVTLADEESSKTTKKLKKLSKHNESKLKEATDETDETKKKKKKKKRKSVSFSETVTEYITQDLDTSSQSNESSNAVAEPPIIVQARIKDERSEEAPDEGIERDCGFISADLGQQSFEEVQRKHTKKRATHMFLLEVFPEAESEKIFNKEKKKNKLKMLQDEEVFEKYKRKHDNDIDANERFKRRCEEITYKSMKKKKKKKHKEKCISSIARSFDKVKISDAE